MKKKLFAVCVISLIVLFGGGCMRQAGVSTKSNRGADAYLKNKYQQSFSYISPGDDVWSSKTKSLIYQDNNGNEFTVRDTDGQFSDNYCSVIFDKQIETAVREKLETKYKFFVCSKSEYFGSSYAFDDVDGYLAECAVINAAVIAKEGTDFDEIAYDIQRAIEHGEFSVVIYSVSDSAFAEKKSYEGTIPNSEIYRTGNFWIADSTMTSKSW